MATRPASRALAKPRKGRGRPAAGAVPRLRDRLNANRSSRLLGALADPERLRIIQCLESGPRAVGEVCRALGSPLANVSHHLQNLRHAGLVRAQRRGRNVIYSLTPNLFRPPDGDAPAALDFGSCRVELGRAADLPPIPGPQTAPDRSGARSARRPAPAPRVEGRWSGQWQPSGAANASTARGQGRKEIACVVKSVGGGTWHATFQGESGHAYAFNVIMHGRQEGDAVLFKGSADLGEQNGGVFDWLGRATERQFVGYYSSAHYTGVFSLKRSK
jgi:ArsR family transcriptional regulator